MGLLSRSWVFDSKRYVKVGKSLLVSCMSAY
jgi:hypothetical protein